MRKCFALLLLGLLTACHSRKSSVVSDDQVRAASESLITINVKGNATPLFTTIPTIQRYGNDTFHIVSTFINLDSTDAGDTAKYDCWLSLIGKDPTAFNSWRLNALSVRYHHKPVFTREIKIYLDSVLEKEGYSPVAMAMARRWGYSPTPHPPEGSVIDLHNKELDKAAKGGDPDPPNAAAKSGNTNPEITGHPASNNGPEITGRPDVLDPPPGGEEGHEGEGDKGE